MNKKPLNTHPVIINIKSTVSHLLMPALEPLYQAFIDVKTAINQQRSDLHTQVDEQWIDAMSAANRLIQSDSSIPKDDYDDYFLQIQNATRSKNE